MEEALKTVLKTYADTNETVSQQFYQGLCLKAIERIEELEKIAELALDLHTKDPLIINDRWGVSGVQAEKLLCQMIEKGV